MKTICLYHGICEANKTQLTMSAVRWVEQYARTLGLKRYDDSYYRGWIHPYAVGDLLMDATFDGLIDIWVNKDTKDYYDSVRFAGVRFRQTTTVSSLYLFGANSDPFDVEYMYLKSNGKESAIFDTNGKLI